MAEHGTFRPRLDGSEGSKSGGFSSGWPRKQDLTPDSRPQALTGSGESVTSAVRASFWSLVLSTGFQSASHRLPGPVPGSLLDTPILTRRTDGR